MTEESHNRATPSRDVFVSYASQDAAIANAVVENLERQGTKCWIAPRDVTPGSPYADEIVGAINDAKILVLVLSQHAIDSAHVGKEIERASSKRRRIIGLRTDAAPLTRSFEYFLSESQWIDVAVLGMPGALTRLTQAVGQGLSPSSWVSPGLGADAGNPADRKRKPSYLTIQRVIAAAVFLVVAAVVVGVVVRYWPSKQGGAPAPVPLGGGVEIREECTRPRPAGPEEPRYSDDGSDAARPSSRSRDGCVSRDGHSSDLSLGALVPRTDIARAR
jgi:hypothetical protein